MFWLKNNLLNIFLFVKVSLFDQIKDINIKILFIQMGQSVNKF